MRDLQLLVLGRLLAFIGKPLVLEGILNHATDVCMTRQDYG